MLVLGRALKLLDKTQRIVEWIHAKRVRCGVEESKKSGCTVQCTAVVCSLEDVLDGHLFCKGC